MDYHYSKNVKKIYQNKMGQGINHEDAASLEESLRRSNFCERITSFPLKVFNFILDCMCYGPGIGKITTERIIKHRVAKVNTTAGNLSFPIIKMPSFELNLGFFTSDQIFEPGTHDMDQFLEKQGGMFPENTRINTIETYWILNYRRPKDIRGEKSVYCFIENELDGLIYIYHLKNNELIDYEKIIANYEAEIENLDFMEKVEKEIVNLGSISNFMDELEKEDKQGNEECIRKRIKTNNCCSDACSTQDFCFNPNSTSTPRSQKL